MQRLRNVSLAERFWQKVEKTNSCWNWIGARNKKGYGLLNPCGHSTTTIASRISWEIHNGEIPEDMDILHKCDNPRCVNPAHLFLGDDFDNQQDCKKKGRFPDRKGGRHPKAKLTEEQVRELRYLYFAERRLVKELAAFYGICESNVSMITTRRTWTN